MIRFLATVGTVLFCVAFSGQVRAQSHNVATQGASVPTVPQSEEDTLFALGSANDKEISGLQSNTLRSAMALKIDYAAWCKDATEVTRLSGLSYEQALGYLRQMQADGKPTSRLERVFLQRSGFVDKALESQYQYCSRAQSPNDEDTQEATYTGQLLAAYAVAKSDNTAAQTAHDRLSYIGRLQSMDTLLKKALDQLDIFAMFAKSAGGPRVRALLAKSPGLHDEYTIVHRKYEARIAPILHPGEADPNAPYVFRPLEVQAVSSDDKAFEADFSRLMFKALEPSLAVMQSMTHPDSGRDCAYTRFAVSEMHKVRDYGQAYIKSRESEGAAPSEIRASLAKVDQALATTTQTSETMCTSYRNSGQPQALYDAARSALDVASAQQDAAVGALNAAISKADDAGKCHAGRNLLGIMTEKMIRLELITVLTERAPQDDRLKAYMAGIGEAAGKSEGLIQQAAAIEAKACPASVVVDMTMD